MREISLFIHKSRDGLMVGFDGLVKLYIIVQIFKYTVNCLGLKPCIRVASFLLLGCLYMPFLFSQRFLLKLRDTAGIYAYICSKAYMLTFVL